MKPGRAQASAGVLLGLGALLYAAWISGPSPASAPCSCELERSRSGWCEACDVGYVAEVPLRSRVLYDALDAHGHDVDVAGLPCADCRAAAAADGFCARHARGFVSGRAYLSRLAYHVARGEQEAIPHELVLLATAVQMAERCELCAAAMVLDGTCPKCRLSYEDGRASPAR